MEEFLCSTKREWFWVHFAVKNGTRGINTQGHTATTVAGAT